MKKIKLPSFAYLGVSKLETFLLFFSMMIISSLGLFAQSGLKLVDKTVVQDKATGKVNVGKTYLQTSDPSEYQRTANVVSVTASDQNPTLKSACESNMGSKVTFTHTNVTNCSGVPCDGSLKINFSGLTQGPITNIVWDGGQTGATQTNMCASTAGYKDTIRFKDGGGCNWTFSISGFYVFKGLQKGDGSDSLRFTLWTQYTHSRNLFTPQQEFWFCDGDSGQVWIGNRKDTLANKYQFDMTKVGIVDWTTGGYPLTYTWTNPPAGNTPGPLVIYPTSTNKVWNITVMDKGCISSTYSSTVDIYSQPLSSFASGSSLINPKCNGVCNGVANATVTGGTGPFTYSWKWPGGSSTGSSSNTSLCAGTFTLTVTDKQECRSVTTATLTTPPPIAVVTPTATATGCGPGTGTASVSASGGTAPLTYNWSGGKTGATITGLVAGTYVVTVIDANLCTKTASATVNPPSGGPGVTISSQVNASCFGSTNGIAAASATGSVSYSWSTGATSATVTNLGAATYTVTVTDLNNQCTSVKTVTITAPDPFDIQETITKINCKGASTGAINTNPIGNTLPYSFVWGPPVNKTSQNITGLTAGSYSLTITDNAGCTGTFSYTLTEPAAAIASTVTETTKSNCNASTGVGTVTATGGTTGYTYSWSNGSTGTTASNLAAGSYTVKVTDANGCSITKTLSITNPTKPTASIASTTTAGCNQSNGTATVAGSGGTTPYTYAWSNGGTTAVGSNFTAGTSYIVTVTDAKGCSVTLSTTVSNPTPPTASISDTTKAGCGQSNGTATVAGSGGTLPYTYTWSNGATTATASNLFAGLYTATVIDSKGCTVTLTATIANPNPPTISNPTSTLASCKTNDGTASVTAGGGTPPHTYLWSNGSTSATAINLAAGVYQVTVTDSKGCLVATSVNVGSPASPTVTAVATDASCGASNGTAIATPNGGSGAGTYTFLWSPGGFTGALATGLAGGSTYIVVVTDANGCTAATSTSVGISTAGATADFSPSTTIGEPPLNVSFSNTSLGATIFYWSFGDGQFDTINQNPSHIYTIDGKYNICLIAKSSAGCIDSLCKSIEVVGDTISIPNVFTPDGNGKNDFWVVFAKGLKDLEVSIYDRWGLKMWSSTGLTSSWDGRNTNGKECPSGTYYYIVKTTKYDSTIKEYPGFLTLIRQ